MKWTISTAIDSTIANSFLSRMHRSMGNLIIIIEKERLIREWSSQEKNHIVFYNFLPDKLTRILHTIFTEVATIILFSMCNASMYM